MSIHILCSFSKLSCLLLLGCKNSLYILDISPLSDICFANIFSHPMYWCFIFSDEIQLIFFFHHYVLSPWDLWTPDLTTSDVISSLLHLQRNTYGASLMSQRLAPTRAGQRIWKAGVTEGAGIPWRNMVTRQVLSARGRVRGLSRQKCTHMVPHTPGKLSPIAAGTWKLAATQWWKWARLYGTS